MKILNAGFVSATFLVYDICYAFQPCPEGTSPDKLQTYPPSIIIMLFGVIMIYFFEKKIENQILKRVIQTLVAAVSLIISFFVFSILYGSAPCV